MLHIKKFLFNPVCVNTYVISNDEGKCAIVDCGCWTDGEWNELKNYLTSNHLTPIHLLNTHFHLDHVFGNKYVMDCVISIIAILAMYEYSKCSAKEAKFISWIHC